MITKIIYQSCGVQARIEFCFEKNADKKKNLKQMRQLMYKFKPPVCTSIFEDHDAMSLTVTIATKDFEAIYSALIKQEELLIQSNKSNESDRLITETTPIVRFVNEGNEPFKDIVGAIIHLSSIAKNHPLNIKGQGVIAAHELLKHSVPFVFVDRSATSFFQKSKPAESSNIFGSLFALPSVKMNLHPDLKRVLIEEMVSNKTVWLTEFNVGREDLWQEEQKLYDEIEHQLSPAPRLAN